MIKFVAGVLIGLAVMYGIVMVTDLGLLRPPYRIPIDLFKQRWECSISDSSAFWWVTKADDEAVVLELHYPFHREKYEVLQSELPRKIDSHTIPRKLSSSDIQDDIEEKGQ
jgi:hypothetical protein